MYLRYSGCQKKHLPPGMARTSESGSARRLLMLYLQGQVHGRFI